MAKYVETQADEVLYRRMWDAIVSESARSRNLSKAPPLTQAAIAKTIRKDPSTVSHLLSGKELPQTQELLLKIADAYGATRSQVRALLALANAIVARRDGHAKLAELYRESFEPLFEPADFAHAINPAPNIAFNVLLDIGVPRSIAVEIAEDIPENATTDEAIGKLAMALASVNEPSCRAALGAMNEALALVESYKKIAAFHFDVPWRGRLSRVVDRRMRHKAVQTWSRVPNAMLTRIELKDGEILRDKVHGGIEFLVLASGKGEFQLGKSHPVPLARDTREVIAFRPEQPHEFRAGGKGAVLFIASYLPVPARLRDPLEQLIRSASSRKKD